MFSLYWRQIPQASTILAVVVLAGCIVTREESATITSSSSTAPTTTVAAVSPSSGTAVGETEWIAGVMALGKKMIGSTSGDVTITPEFLRAEAKRLSNCGAELAQLGPGADRLQPVLVLARQACDKYEATARCYTAAKSDMERASRCLDDFNEASQLFGVAETTAEGLKDATN